MAGTLLASGHWPGREDGGVLMGCLPHDSALRGPRVSLGDRPVEGQARHSISKREWALAVGDPGDIDRHLREKPGLVTTRGPGAGDTLSPRKPPAALCRVQVRKLLMKHPTTQSAAGPALAHPTPILSWGWCVLRPNSERIPFGSGLSSVTNSSTAHLCHVLPWHGKVALGSG